VKIEENELRTELACHFFTDQLILSLTHSHSRTHSLIHSLTSIIAIKLTPHLLCTPSLPHTLTLTHSHSHSLSLSQVPVLSPMLVTIRAISKHSTRCNTTHTLTHSLSYILPSSPTPTLPHSLTHTLTSRSLSNSPSDSKYGDYAFDLVTDTDAPPTNEGNSTEKPRKKGMNSNYRVSQYSHTFKPLTPRMYV
jgi:hypothetical protein